ncbi:MAG: O-methyltransferase [Bacillota bacterium]|nr:O-methyltransferase [Bacillota bacterium]
MLNEKLHSYIENLIPARNNLLSEMELFAKENSIPIMELASMEAMLQIVNIQKPKKILEVGTAIGYSTLRFAYALPETSIVSIERDEGRYQLAREYINRSGLNEQITLIHGDALEVMEKIHQYAPFDAIFIDAAKGQYKKFFEIYSNELKEEGIIITDNVLFKGLVYEKEIESRSLRSLVKKIDHFNRWLMNHDGYQTMILPVGDGVAISKKRGETK